jgi:hypothetical protein
LASNAPTPQTSPFDTYLTGLNCSRTSPRGFREALDLFALENRIVLCAVGMPGVGKSASVYQCAKDRGCPFPVPGAEDGSSMVLHVPQIGVDDLYLPSVPEKGDPRYFERRIPQTFRKLFEYAEKHRDEILAGKRKPPILLIEEPNRAREKAVITAIFTIIEDRRIGDAILPQTVQIVLLMNPNVGGMAVHPFEKDSASRRRVTFVGVVPSMSEWLRHAGEAKYNKTVIDFVAARPKMFYDEQALLNGALYPCPASWQSVAQMVDRCEKEGVPVDGDLFLTMAAGKVGMTAAAAFVDFARNRTVHVVPGDILTKYREVSDVRSRVMQMVKDNRNDVLAELAHGVAAMAYAAAPADRPAPRTVASCLALFLHDIPVDVATQLMVRMTSDAKDALEGQAYFKVLSSEMSKEQRYQEVMKRMAEARRREQAEKIQSAADGPSDPNAN